MMPSDPKTVFQTERSGDLNSDLIENSPLQEASSDSIDELLDRINEDLLAGAPHRITVDDERLKKLIAIYRAQAEVWVLADQNKPKRATKRDRSTDTSMALDLDL